MTKRLKRRSPALIGVGAAAAVAAALLTGAAQAPATGTTAAASFPQTWHNYAGNQERNAAYSVPASAPAVVRQGVSWQYAEANALPLNGGPYDENVLGYLAASVKTTQMIGNAVGVTAIDGKIIAESDSNTVYALDAVTGHKIWEAHTISAAMGNAVVGDGLVFVGAGDTGFSFSSVLKYAGGNPGVSRGMAFSAVYAFDLNTGKLAWKYDTVGQDMPSLVYRHGVVYFGNGDGHMYALDAKSGKAVWITHVGGFDSMSSANWYHGVVLGKERDVILAGFSDPNYLYAFDAKTGAVVWKSTVDGVFNTGMGDNSPTVDSTTGTVLQDSVVDFNKAAGTSNLVIFATDAHTGNVVWQTRLGAGPIPPAYKAAISMVHTVEFNGKMTRVVYVGDPANGHLTALDEATGAILWSTDLGTYTYKGKTYQIQNRGGPTLYRGVLYQAAGAYIFALDPKTGTILSRYEAGGRFGIVNPVIVGGTMYLDNSWDWVQAIPLSKIYAHWATGPAS